jgi:acetolactate synthase-1/2/3 large subunit
MPQRAVGRHGVKLNAVAECRPALERAVESGKQCVIDIVMQNELVPTAGHWNIVGIYSPGTKVNHASVMVAAKRASLNRR